ncbi:HCNGP-like protein-domain-containing protein [Coniochaeta sp. 2T2.1]|nr:HCNGP-like protein-domain-containing protein [Coniochaeta sp. 2T2.1]
MAVLVGYDSSDEDEEVQQPAQTKATSQPPKPTTENGINNPAQPPPQAPQPQPQAQPPSSSSSTAQQGPVQGPALGPALGPSLPASTSTPEPSASAPTTLSLLQDLTLPPVPNTAIPPSPPGSPTPASRALTAKFDNFLALKRTKGIHFNDRLASSEAFRNPGAMDKLLGFVGVGTEFDGEGKGEDGGKKRPGTGQYETTLPEGVWGPNALPAWAYKTPLRRAQERTQKERERKVGEGVEFVSAGAMEGSGLVGGGTPGAGAVPSVTGKRKTRFDS